MSSVIEWSLPALDDLAEIAMLLRQEDAGLAESMVRRIFASAELLSPYPLAGRVGRVASTRELVVRRSPYLLVYLVEEARVVVVRVLHERKDWPGPDNSDAP